LEEPTQKDKEKSVGENRTKRILRSGGKRGNSEGHITLVRGHKEGKSE
jgi:hypothetical protein